MIKAAAGRAPAGVRAAGGLIVQTAKHWLDHDAPRLAAALSYYALLSVAPLLMVSVAVAGTVFGEAAARGELMLRLAPVIGSGPASEAAEFFQQVRSERSTVGATVLSLVILGYAASNIFSQLRGALNLVWRAPRSRRSFKAALRTRLVEALLVATTGVLLMASVMVDAVLRVLSGRFGAAVPGIPILTGDSALSFGLIALLIALIYEVLPDTRISWRDVWIGALVTTLLLIVGMRIFGLYVSRGALTSVYGATGTVVAFLLWVYYSAMVFLFGAEFTHTFAVTYGSRRGHTFDDA